MPQDSEPDKASKRGREGQAPAAPATGAALWLDRLRSRAGRGRYSVPVRFGASGAAGLVLFLAYIRTPVPEASFLGVIPFVALASRERAGLAALLGATFGAAFALPALAWMGCVTAVGWLALALFFSASFAGVGAGVSFLVRRVRLPAAVATPLLWVSAEIVRANIFTGFPWLLLGHGLSDRLLLIQIADLGGVYAVSFLVCVVCGAVSDAVFRGAGGARSSHRTPMLAAALLAAALIYGGVRLAATRLWSGPTLLLIQGNIDTPRASATLAAQEEVDEEIWRVHEELSRLHAGEGELLVWSESMLPGYLGDPENIASAREAHDAGARYGEKLASLLSELGVALLTGGNATGTHPALRGPEEAASFAEATKPAVATPRRRADEEDYNSAFLFDERGALLGRYDKIRLVPFGEYTPLEDWPLFASFSPYAVHEEGYARGDLRQPLMEWNGIRIGVLICYEDAFPGLSRRAAGLGAEMLVNLSSEAWFPGSLEIPQHFRISRFRAVEMRLPLVRCCNVGVSAFLDPLGRVVEMLPGSDRPEGASGVLIGRVRFSASGGRTLYALTGDLFAWMCLAASAGAFAGFFVKKRLTCRKGKS